MSWRGVQPVKEGDERPRCLVKVRRSGRLTPCARLANLCDIQADRFRFHILMDLCQGHQRLLSKWKPDIRVVVVERRKHESEVA